MKTLIVTEKPKVAERIAVSIGNAKKFSNNGVSYFEVDGVIVASAVGYIFGLREKNEGRWTYPVFDIEWVPNYEMNKSASFTKKYLQNIKKLAKECDHFINACDYDIEGSVIGYNAIKYGCGVLWTSMRFRLNRWHVAKFGIFDPAGRKLRGHDQTQSRYYDAAGQV